ncbi:MAG: hypothetical protein V7637_6162 [Mycobacteriales bacterium]|jgi:hypothetical protein
MTVTTSGYGWLPVLTPLENRIAALDAEHRR